MSTSKESGYLFIPKFLRRRASAPPPTESAPSDTMKETASPTADLRKAADASAQNIKKRINNAVRKAVTKERARQRIWVQRHRPHYVSAPLAAPGFTGCTGSYGTSCISAPPATSGYISASPATPTPEYISVLPTAPGYIAASPTASGFVSAPPATSIYISALPAAPGYVSAPPAAAGYMSAQPAAPGYVSVPPAASRYVFAPPAAPGYVSATPPTGYQIVYPYRYM